MLARTSTPALVALAALLGGCAPSPEAVCAHLVTLSKAELAEAVAEISAEELAKLEARCVHDATLDREADAQGYERRAECVLAAADLAAVDACQRGKQD